MCNKIQTSTILHTSFETTYRSRKAQAIPYTRFADHRVVIRFKAFIYIYAYICKYILPQGIAYINHDKSYT